MCIRDRLQFGSPATALADMDRRLEILDDLVGRGFEDRELVEQVFRVIGRDRSIVVLPDNELLLTNLERRFLVELALHGDVGFLLTFGCRRVDDPEQVAPRSGAFLEVLIFSL